LVLRIGAVRAYLFKCLNRLASLWENWCEDYATGRHPNTVHNFLRTVNHNKAEARIVKQKG